MVVTLIYLALSLGFSAAFAVIRRAVFAQSDRR
jgi:hypothetical protein